jgi:hypothetical protein
MMESNALIVVAHYASRPRAHLDDLIKKLSSLTTDLIIVINDDDVFDNEVLIEDGVKFIRRQNIGMNISAWWYAYSKFPNYENYVFLQDECVVINDNFVSAYASKLSKPMVGLVGESINFKWAMPWSEIAMSGLNYEVQINNFSIKRVSFYLDMLRRWQINPGLSGKHMRALVWAFKRSTLEKIGPFPSGRNKEECIAAEIAVSKKVEEIGLLVEQVATSPFSYIKHLEWRSDGLSKLSQ